MNILILLSFIILGNSNGIASESNVPDNSSLVKPRSTQKPSHNKQKQQYADLMRQNKTLQEQKQELERKLGARKQHFREAGDQLLIEQEKYKDLQTRHQGILADYTDLEKKNKNLQDKKEELEKELRQKDDKLGQANQLINRTTQSLKETIDQSGQFEEGVKHEQLKNTYLEDNLDRLVETNEVLRTRLLIEKEENKRLQENLGMAGEDLAGLRKVKKDLKLYGTLIRTVALNKNRELKHSLEKLELSRKFNIVGGIVVFAVCLGGMDRLFQTIIRPKLEKFLHKNTAGSGLSEKQVQFKLQIGRIIWGSVSGLIIGCAEVLVFSKYLSFKKTSLTEISHWSEERY